MAKNNNKVTIDGTHHPSARRKIKILQRGKNVGHALSATFKCAAAMIMSTGSDGNDEKWTVVRRRKRDKLTKVKYFTYVQISNAYATLPQFSAAPTPHN